MSDDSRMSDTGSDEPDPWPMSEDEEDAVLLQWGLEILASGEELVPWDEMNEADNEEDDEA
jgi:hypothetical protein